MFCPRPAPAAPPRLTLGPGAAWSRGTHPCVPHSHRHTPCHIWRMGIVPLFGHATVRQRLSTAIDRSTLPGSILLQGNRGIGKQRLALWLAQQLVCERSNVGEGGEGDQPRDNGTAERGCGRCLACRSVLDLRHPDVYWFYPRPRLRNPDASASEVLEDFGESNAERLASHGLYPRPSGSEGIYIATVRTLVQRASLAPAMGRRKVFIVGDADRMISQEGADQAANAFLKLLEEPPADTTIVLTSSEPGALLPTIRSRVVAIRCAPLGREEVLAFLKEPVVNEYLGKLELPRGESELVMLAAGAPGDLISAEGREAARAAALRLLRAATSSGAERYATALAQGGAQARGGFADALTELNVLLRERTRRALSRNDAAAAAAAAAAGRAISAVCEAQARADGNVNPQLVTTELLRALQHLPA